MFDKSIYVERRKKLKELVGSGLLFFPGNVDVPMNYPGNIYPFRQDSNFLYYFGLDTQGLGAVIDIDDDTEIIFGNDRSVDDVVWMGEDESMAEKASLVGVENVEPFDGLETKVKDSIHHGQKIHYLPHYRGETILFLSQMLGINPFYLNSYASSKFISSVVKQRSVKSPEEIEQIEKALDISYVMFTLAMKIVESGTVERQVAGAAQGVSLSMGMGLSFPMIFSVHGETLHNDYHGNTMKDGEIVVMDSGAESLLHYASDITRTIPVNGKYSDIQKDIYNTVLNAQLEAIKVSKPGIKFREVHLTAAKVIAEGLKEVGIMKGNADNAVEAGAHALFFPHGLGHMMGLDVHDMEGLGENNVGYDEETKRSEQFGLAYLRMGRTIEPGFVLTVEPGIYFIPQLIQNWKAKNKCAEFINYSKAEEFLSFGGIRIEDDILITEDSAKVLGKPIPKTVEEVEAQCAAE